MPLRRVDRRRSATARIEIGFDGTETADTGVTAERQVIFAGGTKIVVKRDGSLCWKRASAARLTNIKRMVAQTGDTVRSQVIAMIERCPSGSYGYAIERMGLISSQTCPSRSPWSPRSPRTARSPARIG